MTNALHIGIDFDNTIACYDGVFFTAARERGLVPKDLARDKTSVRDYMRANDIEDEWTNLQGWIYGERMDLAKPYDGAQDFVRVALGAGQRVSIVSHKTRHPYLGPKYELHTAAREFLETEGFFDAANGGLDPKSAYFELTLNEKLARIGALGCTHFIDDLPEFLMEESFPADVSKILFDPYGHCAGGPFKVCRSWAEIADFLLVSRVTGP